MHKARKKGTPKIEVIIPAGNSDGAIIMRASKSDSSNKIAPKIILNGISFLALGPIILRTMCGAISPTNPIVPPAQTAELTARAPLAKTSIRKRLTSTPNAEAEVSPPESRSREGAIANIIQIEIIEKGRIK